MTVPLNIFPTPKLHITLEEKNNNKFCQAISWRRNIDVLFKYHAQCYNNPSSFEMYNFSFQ